MTADEVKQTKTGIEDCERGQQEGSCHWVGHLEGTWGASLTISTAVLPLLAQLSGWGHIYEGFCLLEFDGKNKDKTPQIPERTAQEGLGPQLGLD